MDDRAPSEPTRPMLRLVSEMRLRAASLPPYTGFGTPQDKRVLARCNHAFAHSPELVASLVFSRDAGMHTSGWWKNPDYERCEHLSIGFGHAMRGRIVANAPQHHAHARAWCLALFGAARLRLLWVEPPFSPIGKQRDIYHYRLFLAPDWRLPVLPRKEVYSRDFTEFGWKSWSDLHGPRPDFEAPP